MMPASAVIPAKTPMEMPAIAPPERSLALDDEDEEDAGLDAEVANEEDEEVADNDKDEEDVEDPVADVVGEEDLADAFNSTISVEKAEGVAVGVDVPITEDGSALYSFS